MPFSKSSVFFLLNTHREVHVDMTEFDFNNNVKAGTSWYEGYLYYKDSVGI